MRRALTQGKGTPPFGWKKGNRTIWSDVFSTSFRILEIELLLVLLRFNTFLFSLSFCHDDVRDWKSARERIRRGLETWFKKPLTSRKRPPIDGDRDILFLRGCSRGKQGGNALWDIEFRFLLLVLCHWIYQLRDSNWPRVKNFTLTQFAAPCSFVVLVLQIHSKS